MDECIIDEKQYALPFMRSTEALYINKTYVEKLGYEIPEVVTWDFIFEVSEAALAKDEEGNYLVNGQKIMIPFIYKSTDNMLISMLKQLDAPYSQSDGTIEIFNDTTTSVLKMIGEHAQSGAFSTFKISSYPANFLNAGQCIFAVDSTAGATWMGSKAPLLDIAEEQLVDFETEVKVIPQYDPDKKYMISQGPSLCIFNKNDPQEVMASWLFTQFLIGNSVQIGYAMTEGYIPVTLKAQNSAEYQEYINMTGSEDKTYYQVKLDASKLLIDNIDNTFVTPVFNGSASLRDAAGSLVENTCKSARRNEKLDDGYYKALFEKVTSLYHLDQTQNIDISKDLGPLPETAKILLGTLAISWILLGLYGLRELRKQKS